MTKAYYQTVLTCVVDMLPVLSGTRDEPAEVHCVWTEYVSTQATEDSQYPGDSHRVTERCPASGYNRGGKYGD